jgi:hypothetical protein
MPEDKRISLRMGLDPLSPEAAAIRQLKEEGQCTCIDPCPVHGVEMPFMITVDKAVETVRRAILGDLMAGNSRWRYEQAFERAERALLALEGRVPGPTPGPAEPEAATDSVGGLATHLAAAEAAMKAMLQQPDPERAAHLAVLLHAYWVFVERDSGQRHGVWRRSGIKGQVMHLFAKAERAFMALFQHGELPDDDHLLDAINYAVFAVRLRQEAFSRWAGDIEAMEKAADGEWPWT